MPSWRPTPNARVKLGNIGVNIILVIGAIFSHRGELKGRSATKRLAGNEGAGGDRLLE